MSRACPKPSPAAAAAPGSPPPLRRSSATASTVSPWGRKGEMTDASPLGEVLPKVARFVAPRWPSPARGAAEIGWRVAGSQHRGRRAIRSSCPSTRGDTAQRPARGLRAFAPERCARLRQKSRGSAKVARLRQKSRGSAKSREAPPKVASPPEGSRRQVVGSRCAWKCLICDSNSVMISRPSGAQDVEFNLRQSSSGNNRPRW